MVLDRLSNDLHRMSIALCGDSALAEDAVQETLLHVRDDAGQFVPRGADADGDAKRWIMRICATTSLQLVRRRRRAARNESSYQAFTMNDVKHQPPPEAALLKREQIEAVRTALGNLPEPMRMAISLHHIAGLEFAEVAHALGIPAGTAKTRVHRGLAKLRQHLESAGVNLSVASIGASLQHAAHDIKPVHDWTALLHSPPHATLHLGKGSLLAMTIKLAVPRACATLAVSVAPLARSEEVRVQRANQYRRLREDSRQYWTRPGQFRRQLAARIAGRHKRWLAR